MENEGTAIVYQENKQKRNGGNECTVKEGNVQLPSRNKTTKGRQQINWWADEISFNSRRHK